MCELTTEEAAEMIESGLEFKGIIGQITKEIYMSAHPDERDDDEHDS